MAPLFWLALHIPLRVLQLRQTDDIPFQAQSAGQSINRRKWESPTYSLTRECRCPPSYHINKRYMTGNGQHSFQIQSYIIILTYAYENKRNPTNISTWKKICAQRTNANMISVVAFGIGCNFIIYVQDPFAYFTSYFMANYRQEKQERRKA